MLNGQGEIKVSQEYSEKVANKKMFSRVDGQVNENKLEKSGTFNIKHHAGHTKSDKYGKMKVSNNQSNSNSQHWKNDSTPNVEQRRGMEVGLACEEYGTKIDDDGQVKENMVRLTDMKKDYKSSQINPKGQFNKFSSNKNSKQGVRKIKHERKHKENIINDESKRKGEGHKIRPKKLKSRRHKRRNQDKSF